MKKQKQLNRFGCEDFTSGCVKAAGHVETVSVEGSCRESLGQGVLRPPAPATVCLRRETNNMELRFHIFVVGNVGCRSLCKPDKGTTAFMSNSCFPFVSGVHTVYLMPRLPRLDGIGMILKVLRNVVQSGPCTCLWKTNHKRADTQHLQLSQILILMVPLPQCCTATWTSPNKGTKMTGDVSTKERQR